MIYRWILWSSFVVLFSSSHAWAQADVCCVMAKVVNKGVDTSASVMSPSECSKGKRTDRGFTACTSFADENNTCSTTSEESRCKTCGYFWNGKTCMTEDPVKKAKKELEEEAKKKEGPKNP
ncbi:MAG TPA: hypothetical protein VI895_06410 [Bdellovibrionota bacterium]|nr:hypothetical protein [Bdellovibrionota bacterium]